MLRTLPNQLTDSILCARECVCVCVRETGEMGMGGRWEAEREKLTDTYKVGVRLAPCLAVGLILLLPPPAALGAGIS